MQVHVELPEDIAQAMVAGGQDLARAAAQSIAIEGYRSGRLSEEQVRRLLGFESRLQVHGFLKEHGAFLHYTVEDLEQDAAVAQDVARRARGDARTHNALPGE